ncbi:hypothetical protein JJE66_20050 [Bradyrhizobium diazoefficiens]|uniref:hypothetical protein n=1 Tax=Bradyrhizobium diazoefficiens TaxID=1355477 RepID=UPI00190BFC23|nr:hypothetical protein [Bradyrhizobium diazoefficiens]MBK3663502.1 hypothetical protein [Bradyrhizobium diazoefficiens]
MLGVNVHNHVTATAAEPAWIAASAVPAFVDESGLPKLAAQAGGDLTSGSSPDLNGGVQRGPCSSANAPMATASLIVFQVRLSHLIFPTHGNACRSANVAIASMVTDFARSSPGIPSDQAPAGQLHFK